MLIPSALPLSEQVIVSRLNISEISYSNLPRLPIVEEISAKVKQIEKALEENGFDRFRLVLAGSLVCGHYTQPKPSTHSLNPNCPYGQVIECDMRIILPEGTPILDPSHIERLEKACGARKHFTHAKTISRFGDEIPMVVMYDYTDITDDVGLEFEICANVEPYFEIASVWNEVFTREEVERQTQIRDIARSVLELDYHSEFQVLKAVQTAECRYRVCANYWMLVNYPEMIGRPETDYKPLSVRIQPYLMPKIHTWFEDADRPYNKPYPEGIVEKFSSIGMEHLLLRQPETPTWFKFVESIKSSS